MDRRELGVYVHIPFCVRKCAYCDFLSFPASPALQAEYFRALREEITLFERPEEYEVISVYFGGGTPSLPPSGEITETLDVIRRTFFVSGEAEITIECNPGTLDRGRLKNYRQAGFNRLSIGLQSADDSLLRQLGRIHTWEDFHREYRQAREEGFDNISVDLMYGLPRQTLSSWKETLDRVRELRPEHLSAYSLIIEEGTLFWELYQEDDLAKKRGDKPLFLPDEDAEDRMLKILNTSLREIGMYRYEISNYAVPGRESRHNTGYWKRREYAGFGLGASGQIGRVRYRNKTGMKDYLCAAFGENPGTDIQDTRGEMNRLSIGRRCREEGSLREESSLREENILNKEDSFREEETLLSREEEIAETMILGLRMTEGVDLLGFEETFSERAEELFSHEIEQFRQAGLLELSGHHLRLTERGFDVSNLVMCAFI